MARMIAIGVRTVISFFAAGRDHHAVVLDAATGCEFLDDRIRLLD